MSQVEKRNSLKTWTHANTQTDKHRITYISPDRSDTDRGLKVKNS